MIATLLVGQDSATLDQPFLAFPVSASDSHNPSSQFFFHTINDMSNRALVAGMKIKNGRLLACRRPLGLTYYPMVATTPYY